MSKAAKSPAKGTRVSLGTGAIVANDPDLTPLEVLRTSPTTGEYVGRDPSRLAAIAGTRPDPEPKEAAERPARRAPVDLKGAKVAKRDAQLATATVSGASIAMREASPAAEGDGRTIEGIAVPYGEPTLPGATAEYPGMREAFDAGAFADVIASRAGRPFPLLDRHDGTPIGGVVLEDSPEGLRYRGRLLSSPAATSAAELIREGLVGPSIEFVIGATRRAGDTVHHTAVRALAGIALTYRPAHAGSIAAREGITGGHPVMDHCAHCGTELAPGAVCTCPASVAARAAGTLNATTTPAERAAAPGARGVELPTDDSMRAIAREAALEVVRRHLEGRQGVADPFADLRGYRSIGALFHAAAQDGASTELRSYAARSLADQLTTDSNAGVTNGIAVGQVRGIVSRGRRAITAFGGPRPLSSAAGDAGMSANWPYFDGDLTALVGEQSTEKTEITSAKVEIKNGTEAIRTFAGGSDISYQLIRRSNPSYLDAYARIMLLAYAVVTDAAFVAELESGSVTGDTAEALASVDATELKGLLIDAAVTVETATGAPADFALAGTAAFKAAAKLLPTSGSQPSTPGNVDIRGLRVDVGGLPIIHVPSVTTGKYIVSNQEAAGWFEDGPFQATAEDVAKLGRNVAYWGMGVPARFIPGGIVEIYDVTP